MKMSSQKTNWLGQLLLLALPCCFVMLTSVRLSAQSYLPPSEAIDKLKVELNAMHEALEHEDMADDQLDRTRAVYNYYHAIIAHIAHGATVELATSYAITQLCYDDGEGCASLSKSEGTAVVTAVRTLLSN
jgi:hypothetical protein